MIADYKFIGEFLLILGIYFQSDEKVNPWLTRGIAMLGIAFAFAGVLG